MQILDLAQLSLAGSPNPIAEAKYVLWSADGTAANNGTGVTSAGLGWIQDGAAGQAATLSSSSAIKLFTLSSSYSATQKFAFEAAIYAQSGATAYVALWDFSTGGSGSIISTSQISTTSTTATVLRSGQFTLTSGHLYGVTVWAPSLTAYIVDASLIIFP